jgi:hypothetical protein
VGSYRSCCGGCKDVRAEGKGLGSSGAVLGHSARAEGERKERLGLPREANNFNYCFCLILSIVFTDIYILFYATYFLLNNLSRKNINCK